MVLEILVSCAHYTVSSVNNKWQDMQSFHETPSESDYIHYWSDNRYSMERLFTTDTKTEENLMAQGFLTAWPEYNMAQTEEPQEWVRLQVNS